MESFGFSTLDMGHFAPGGLFDNIEIPNVNHQSKLGYEETDNNIINGYGEELLFDNFLGDQSSTGWMEITSDSMSSLLELQEITEVKTEPQSLPQRPSVIKSPIKKKHQATDLTNIMKNCGIEEVGMYDTHQYEPVQSPGELSDVSEMEQNQELIDELEEFFIQTEGSPTEINEAETRGPISSVTETQIMDTNANISVNSESILKALSSGNVLNSTDLSEDDLRDAYTTSMTTEDGQNVIIIIAPSAPKTSVSSPIQSPIHVPCPSPSVTSDYDTNYDTDPEWAPSPLDNIQNSYSDELTQKKIARKKYARSKQPTAPTGPYPTDKKERKKAQNRTAAFRYREKKKTELDDVDLELERLSNRNVVLREKMAEMETEFKYLKKLMTEAGLGHYAAAVHL